MRRILFLFLIVLAPVCAGCGSKQSGPPVATPVPNVPAPLDAAPVAAPPIAPSLEPAKPDVPAEPEVHETSSPAANEKEYVSFPAIGVKLVQPEGFTVAKGFYGFEQPDTVSSILMTRFPTPFSTFTEQWNADALKQRGMTLIASSEVSIDGSKALLSEIRQTASGVDFAKWILVLGDESKIILVTATFPVQLIDDLSETMKNGVLSARFDETPVPPPGSDLDFSIVSSEKLKIAPSGGKLLLYTRAGDSARKAPGQPLFVAAPSLSTVTIENRRQYAVQRIFKTATVKLSTISSVAEVVLDGLDGFEIVAEGESSEPEMPVRVYQVMLFDGETYFLMTGIVGKELSDEFLPEFKAMAHSFKRKTK